MINQSDDIASIHQRLIAHGHKFLTRGMLERELKIPRDSSRQLLEALLEAAMIEPRTNAGYRIVVPVASCPASDASTYAPVLESIASEPAPDAAKAMIAIGSSPLHAPGSVSEPAVPLPLSSISQHPSVQIRGFLRKHVVTAYAAMLSNPTSLPPPVVYRVGEQYILADGFHRVAAAHTAGLKSLPCEVRDGTLRDAALWSLKANVTHGLRLTLAEKREAVLRLLADPEWQQWADTEIARHAGVSSMTVGRLRKRHFHTVKATKRQCRSRYGGTRLMKTDRLGRKTSAAHALSRAQSAVSKPCDPSNQLAPGWEALKQLVAGVASVQSHEPLVVQLLKQDPELRGQIRRCLQAVNGLTRADSASVLTTNSKAA